MVAEDGWRDDASLELQDGIKAPPGGLARAVHLRDVPSTAVACAACYESVVHLHVCRMCRFFDPAVPAQCREDDAEEVVEKERVNFCEWFKPATGAFDPQLAAGESRARSELAALFGDHESGDDGAGDEALQDAEDLFK